MITTHWTRAFQFLENTCPQLGYCKLQRSTGLHSEAAPLSSLEDDRISDLEELSLIARAPIAEGTMLLHTVPMLRVSSPATGDWTCMAAKAQTQCDLDKLSEQQLLYLTLLKPRGGSIAEKILINALCTHRNRGSEFQLILLSLASFFDHSCAPNAALEMDGGAVTVRAVVDIPANTLITLSYIPFPIDSINFRRELLRKQFHCLCNACLGLIIPSQHAMAMPARREHGAACWECGAAHSLSYCGHCKRAWYCSEACQIVNYRNHRALCRAVVT